MSIRVKIINDFNDVSHYQWNDLVKENNTNTIFQTYEWNKAWWETYKEQNKLLIITIMEVENIIGIAPLFIKNNKKKEIKFIGDGRSDYTDFIYRKSDIHTLNLMFLALKEHIQKIGRASLNNIPSYSKTIENMTSFFSENNIHYVKSDPIACPVLVITNNHEHARLVLNKKSLKRHHGYFKKITGYEVNHIKEKEIINSKLNNYFQQHINRWNNTKTNSLFTDSSNKRFYRKLLQYLCDKEWILFTEIKSDGLPIAYHYGFIYGNNFIWYKPSFEITLKKHSPGEALLKELLEYAISNNYEEFDFTVGNEGFKHRFSSKTRENISLTLMNGWIEYLLFKTKIRSKKAIKYIFKINKNEH